MSIYEAIKHMPRPILYNTTVEDVKNFYETSRGNKSSAMFHGKQVMKRRILKREKMI